MEGGVYRKYDHKAKYFVYTRSTIYIAFKTTSSSKSLACLLSVVPLLLTRYKRPRLGLGWFRIDKNSQKEEGCRLVLKPRMRRLEGLPSFIGLN